MKNLLISLKTTVFNQNNLSKRKNVIILLFSICFIFFESTGATLTVTNTNDSGAGSLRSTILSSATGDIIQFSPTLLASGSVTIQLMSEISITKYITINGLIIGTDTLYISGRNLNRIFDIAISSEQVAPETILQNLVLINGYGTNGGAILCTKGNLRLISCIFRNNEATSYGGGVYMTSGTLYTPELKADSCSFEYNIAKYDGGAICYSKSYSPATCRVRVSYSTFFGNKGRSGTSIMVKASPTGNSSNDASAYIYVDQSTFTQNTGTLTTPPTIYASSQSSGSSASASYSYVYVTNSTIAGNSGNGGIASLATTNGKIYPKSSIILGNLQSTLSPVINSLGNNIFSYTSGNIANVTSSDHLGHTMASINLGSLQNNGGKTKTMVPSSPSVAIDNGSTDAINAQNGPISGVRDIGAAEFDQCANDLLPPVADVASLPTINSSCSVSSLTVPTATDNCSGTISGTHNATLPITTSTTITWTYDDGSGNTSTQTQEVIIEDIIAPVPDLANLADVTALCSVVSLTAPTATDNCAGAITGTHNATLPITASTGITWTYDDGNGNTTTQSQNVIIDDVTAPVANTTTLANITTECSVTSLTAPTATDNCAGSISGTHNATLPISTQGTTVVTWTYDDGNGNTSTQTQNVVIDDVTAPVANATTLANITSECSVTSLTAPTATDNCAGSITGTHNATLPISTQGTTVVTWTYDDGNGNTSTQTQNVVINDVTAPVANTSTLANITSECSVTSLTAPTATDNCAGSITGAHNATLPISTQGTTVVTWTYNDGNGNTTTQTQNVIIDDITAPVANTTTLADITNECEVTALTAPTATDNCAASISGTHNATLPISTQGTTVVTWTYDDGNGNTSTQTQNVVIEDITAPVANTTALANITSECSVTSLTAPTATDNCAGSITGTHNATLPISTQGTTVVTWTYDDGNGNTSTQIQNVVIDDVTAPVPNVASLSPVTVQCQINSITLPTATDNCAGSVTGSPNVTFPITTQGTFIITWTYNDGNGNISTQTQSVSVDDNTAPVVDNAILANITSECSVTSLTAPTATDNCSGLITGTHNVTLPLTSSTTITWTYDDGNGNTSTQTQNVIIDDVTAPVSDATTLANITSECSVISLTAPTATDNCAGTITGTHNATLPISTQGTTVVTWTYDDGNGNTSTQTQNVIITPINNGLTQSGAVTLSADATGYNYQWVDCNNGNQVINGATNQTFIATANGSYAVEIDNGSCTVTSSCVVINQVGIEENSSSNVLIYPNPTKGEITISGIDLNTTIEIYNSVGELLKSITATESTTMVSISDYSLGVYYVKLKNSSTESIQKLVKH